MSTLRAGIQLLVVLLVASLTSVASAQDRSARSESPVHVAARVLKA